MGVIEKLLEKEREEHRKEHERLDDKLDVLTCDMVDVKTRLGGVEVRLGKVETRLGGVEVRLDKIEANTADLGEIRARVALIPELQAGQIEIRDMVATLLARSEQGKGS
jgi:hypothetical protein